MKAESIVIMRAMLQSKIEDARYNYKVTKRTLEEKYKTEWLDNVITNEEKKKLYKDKIILMETEKLVEDFENHQW